MWERSNRSCYAIDSIQRASSWASREDSARRKMIRPSSLCRAAPTARKLWPTTASELLSSTKPRTLRQALTTSVFGVRWPPLTVKVASFAPSSLETCPLKPSAPALESCSTPTSKSEILFELRHTSWWRLVCRKAVLSKEIAKRASWHRSHWQSPSFNEPLST